MKKIRNIRDANKGAALILLISLLILCSLVALVAVSLLTQGTTSGRGLVESIQAQAIAAGGREWYLRQLKDDSDWTDEANQTGIALGAGNFDITISGSSASSVSVPFKVTGKVPGYFDQTVQRQVNLVARKLPKACQFAVFWPEDASLTLNDAASGTQVLGNFWSRGSIDIGSKCSVTEGVVYYGAGETVSGSGNYITEPVNSPFPNMPQLDTAYYEGLMAGYDNDIDANSQTDTIVQDTNLNLSGLLECYDFYTEGRVTISGYGKIVAKNDVLLHNKGGAGNQALTITPDPGKKIEILAGNNFLVSNNVGRRKTQIDSGTIMYARNSAGSSSLFEILQSSPVSYTSIDQASILSRRRLIVDNGVTITDSTLYVACADSDTNNLLQIAGGSTVSGKIISKGRDYPSLQIDSAASVGGLVYQYCDCDPIRGRTDISDDAVINGVVLAHRFQGDSLGTAVITYDLPVVLNALPDGWDGYVMTEPYSWDDH